MESVDNTTFGATGLPVISSEITIEGRGYGVSREASAPDFRIMAVDSSGNLTLNQVTISDGRATDLLSSGDLGGGIYGAGSSVLAINNSTIVGNSATSGGGIGAVSASEVTLTNSTVSGNSAEVDGGIFNDGTLSLNHTTITENTATDNGGGIRNQNVANAVNSIVAGPVSGSDCSGGIGLASLDHNIESGASCGLVEPGDQQNVAPTQLNLGPLQGNGGPTETHAPGAGSVAIDAIPNGACTLTEDQQGVLRTVPTDGACDAGAVETIGLVNTFAKIEESSLWQTRDQIHPTTGQISNKNRDECLG